ncbi:hypothetical protein V1264_012512 [Littorina saxatilis]|uniref:ADP-ribosylation factor-like protein 16 n=1 Tax=Littorina saxatilis TaxID=31220 RepID=A0AAN9BXG7_9CAEN
MCLLIGPTGAGKTLLLKSLQAGNYHALKGWAPADLPATVPTTGTNLMTITVNKSRKKEVTVREVGGAMGPIWKNYYSDASAILYVIDVSNRCQVAAACIQLLTMLTHPQTADTPVLLLLNKQDLSSVMPQSEVEWLLRLQDTLGTASQAVNVVEVSAKTGQGLDIVARWIHDNHKDSPAQSHS